MKEKIENVEIEIRYKKRGFDGEGWYWRAVKDPYYVWTGTFPSESSAFVDAKKSFLLNLSSGNTQRGFQRWDFVDRDGVECSIQRSSLGDDWAVWIGCDDPNPMRLGAITGWTKVELPEDTVCTTRMHLTLGQLRQLMPILQGLIRQAESEG